METDDDDDGGGERRATHFSRLRAGFAALRKIPPVRFDAAPPA